MYIEKIMYVPIFNWLDQVLKWIIFINLFYKIKKICWFLIVSNELYLF